MTWLAGVTNETIHRRENRCCKDADRSFVGMTIVLLREERDQPDELVRLTPVAVVARNGSAVLGWSNEIV